MACFHPLQAFQTDAGKIVFSDRRAEWRELTLPCGQCIGCRVERSRQWAVRCMHEASLYDVNSFVTLTYDEANLPANGSLRYRDYQKFMKRLRKTGRKARFFCCGEYGGERGRPHYHACLFGVGFGDRVYYRSMPSGADLYTSEELERLWPFGFSSVGDVTFESAAYVARYVLKKVGSDVERLGVLDMSTGELALRAEEFVRMSLKPGVGAPWLAKFQTDVYPRDEVIVRGVKCKPPRYYDKLVDGEMFMDDVEYRRYCKSLETVADSSVERLRVREICTRARLSFKSRGLEL